MNLSTTRKWILLGMFTCMVLVACSIRPPAVTATASLSATLPPPQAVELGVLGKGSARDMAWSPDSKLLAVMGTLGVYLYDTQTWQVVKTIPESVFGNRPGQSIVFSPDQKSLIMLVYDHPNSSFWRYDLQTGQFAAWFENLNINPQAPPVFSPDGKTFAFFNQICEKSKTDKQNCVQVLELRESLTSKLLTTIPATQI